MDVWNMTNTLILYKKNLKRDSYFKGIEEINSSDFSVPIHSLYQCDTMIYIDEDGNSKVLKNRHGPTTKTIEEDDMTITVGARTGYGKTSVSVLIANLLKQIGVENVKIEDDDCASLPSVELVTDRAKFLRDKLKNVTIKSQQLKR